MRPLDFVSLIRPLIGKSLNNVAYHHFESAQILPYAVYMENDLETFVAENRTWLGDQSIRFEVYTKRKDFALEQEIEELFQDHVWTKEASDWLETENCYMTVYVIN